MTMLALRRDHDRARQGSRIGLAGLAVAAGCLICAHYVAWWLSPDLSEYLFLVLSLGDIAASILVSAALLSAGPQGHWRSWRIALVCGLILTTYAPLFVAALLSALRLLDPLFMLWRGVHPGLLVVAVASLLFDLVTAVRRRRRLREDRARPPSGAPTGR